MNDPTGNSHCAVCGTALTMDANGEWCPRCALGGAFDVRTDESVLFSVPGHAVLAELGRGAAGIVYRARQEQPARDVALKILRPHEAGSAESLARFRLEAATVTALDHPAILPVFSVGEHDGLPYFTMKLCCGSLAERLGNYRRKWRETAGLVALLAEAVQHAHARGVLHRDLKPGNVLFDEADRPFISDFGLAKLVEVPGASGPLTRPQLVMGTPGYLAPEVLAGGLGQATTSADVFALGALLHELLTGMPPPAVAAATAPRPEVPRDLAVICAHALAAEPARRYASATALAEDLHAWLAGRPIAARPVTALGRGWAWAQRNPALAGLTAALGLTLLGATASLALKNQALDVALNEAQAAEARSKASLAESLVAQARAVRQSGREGQRFETLRLIEQAVAFGNLPTGPAKIEALAALALEDWRWIKRLPPLSHLRARDKVGFSADLAECVVSSVEATAPEVRRVEDWTVVRRCAPAAAARIEKIGFGPTAGWIWAYYADETQAVWGPADVAPRWVLRPGSPSAPPALAANGSGWWFTGPENRVGWHDAATGAEHWVGGTGTRIYGLTASPDDRMLAVVRDDRLEVWAVPEGEMRWSWSGDAGLAPAVWSAEGRWLVSDRFVGAPEIVVWDARDGTAVQTLRQGQLRSSLLALHPDGRRLLSLDSEGVLRIWDRWTGRELVRGPAGTHALRLSADGRRAAVGAGFQELGLIELGTDEVVRHFPLAEASRERWATVAVSPDNRWLLAATRASAHVWSLATGREELRWNFSRSEDAKSFFSPVDGRVIYSATEAGVQARAIRAGGARPEWGEVQVITPPNQSMLIDISLDGRRWWVENFARQKIELWPDGEPARRQDVAEGGRNFLFSASDDGRWLASVEKTGKEVRLLELPADRTAAALPMPWQTKSTFSPDGRWLVLGSNRRYEIWRTGEWSRAVQMLPIEQPGALYGYALFSPDSQRLAITTGLNSIGISRPGVWQPDFEFTLPGGAQRDTWAWSKEAENLFVLSGQQTVTAWNIPAAEAALCRLKLAGPASQSR